MSIYTYLVGGIFLFNIHSLISMEEHKQAPEPCSVYSTINIETAPIKDTADLKDASSTLTEIDMAHKEGIPTADLEYPVKPVKFYKIAKYTISKSAPTLPDGKTKLRNFTRRLTQ